MTEQEWLDCADPQAMLKFLQDKASNRKLRLFAVACCRRLGQLLDRDQKTLLVAERYADGLLTLEEFYDAWWDACEAHDEANRLREIRGSVPGAALGVVWLDETADDLFGATHDLCCAARLPNEMALLVDITRDLFGPLPFRPVSVHQDWRTATVQSLAQAIYEERPFDRLPILADALEDAGCSDQDVLHHCRSGGEHFRGCWALDLVLRKN